MPTKTPTKAPALKLAKTDPDVARWLAAVAEPTRLMILRVVAAGPQTVGRIAAAVGAEMVNVSHHLGILRRSGILDDRKAGRFVSYSFADGVTCSAGEGGRLTLASRRLPVSVTI